jgi:hypothetical protein
MLLRELVAIASSSGVRSSSPRVRDNTPMLDVFRRRLTLRESSVDGMRCVDLDLTPPLAPAAPALSAG